MLKNNIIEILNTLLSNKLLSCKPYKRLFLIIRNRPTKKISVHKKYNTELCSKNDKYYVSSSAFLALFVTHFLSWIRNVPIPLECQVN